MNPIKYANVCKLVKIYSDEIQHLLPPLPMHEQRIAPAHLWGALKACYGGYPIKRLPDFEYDNCVNILTYVKQHPTDTREYAQFIPQPMFRDKVYTTKVNALDQIFNFE